MKFKPGLICLLVAGLGANAQNDPTIDMVYVEGGNNFCADGSYKNLVIEVTDIDGDVVNVDNIVFTNGYLEYAFGPAPVTVGNTTTFVFYTMVSGVTPPGVGAIVGEIATVTVSSVSGLDPTAADSEVLSGLVVNGPVYVEFSSPYLEVCSNGLPMDLDPMVSPAGGEYSWGYIHTPYSASNSNAFEPARAYDFYAADGFDGYTISYFVTNVNGCVNQATMNVTFYDPPTVFVSPTPSTCGNADGSAVASITLGQIPYDIYWSTGKTEIDISSSTNITNVSSGVYYLNVTDNFGCKTVAKANISDNDVTVTPTITESRCTGQPGSVDLNINVSIGSVSSVFWSNGQTTPVLTAAPGEYSVEIHTTANCNYFGTYVIPDSALKVVLDGVYDNFNCLSAPDGYIYISTMGGNGPYTWDWTKNGSPAYVTEDIVNIEGGVYSCTVQDNDGCSLTWGKTVGNYNNVVLYTTDIVRPTCGNSNGSADIYIETWGDVPAFYEWSNGATTEDLSNVPAGNYTLTYTDQAGCTSYLTVKLLNVLPYQPSVCLLTVDTSLIYNQIVWEKDITQNVTGFNVYRETSVFGEFEKVATRPYSLESFYEDNAASPIDRSWRYYITTYDACGNESYGSFIHKTIHVVANTTNGTDYTLNWDNYEGISYSTIDLHRYDPVNGWVTIAPGLAYGTNTFADTPPLIAGLDYMVTFNLTDVCTSTKAQDHNSSRSNKTASVFNAGGSTAEIVDDELGLISIYPNPATNIITLHLDKPELFQYYEITDLNGKVISTGTISTNNTSIDLYDMAAGVYLIRLVSDSKIITNKFVKN